MARVSVIALTRNHAWCAQNALFRIDAQTYRDVEVIVTDDGSVDSTPDIVDRWRRRTSLPTSFIRHDDRRGVCRTVNEALHLASGSFVAVVSLDDLWFPRHLAFHVELFDEVGAGVAVVYNDSQVIDMHGRVTDPSYMARHTWVGLEGRPPPSGDVFEEIVRNNFIATPGVTMRRSAIEEVGGYDEQLLLEDWDMWIRLAERFEYRFDDRLTSRYRLHERGYWQELRRAGLARPSMFQTLVKALGARPEADAHIVKQLRSLVDEMVRDGDPGADAFADRLRQVTMVS